MVLPTYSKPPIVEAIIELQFDVEREAEQLIAELRASMGGPFDVEPEARANIQFEAAVDHEGVSLKNQQQQRLYLLRASSGHEAVSCGASTLTTHALTPYQGWDSLIANARRAASVPSLADAQLNAVLVRYIDRIDLPAGELVLSEYFPLLPQVPSAMPDPVDAFRWSIATRSAEGDLSQISVMSTPPAATGGSIVVFDITLSRMAPTPATPSSGEWERIAEELHRRQRQIFEQSISDRARELFR